MKILPILILLFIGTPSFSQTFLKAYEEFRISKIKSEKSSKKLKKSRIKHLSTLIFELDTLFTSYTRRTNFDFNSADTIKIIRQSDIQSAGSTFIIWSGKNIISYEEEWIENLPFRKKVITYKPFLDTTWNSIGFQKVDERDSLITLVNKNDFITTEKLSKENPIIGGASSTIIVAFKINGQYHIEQYYLNPFGIPPNLMRTRRL